MEDIIGPSYALGFVCFSDFVSYAAFDRYTQEVGFEPTAYSTRPQCRQNVVSLRHLSAQVEAVDQVKVDRHGLDRT